MECIELEIDDPENSQSNLINSMTTNSNKDSKKLPLSAHVIFLALILAILTHGMTFQDLHNNLFKNQNFKCKMN